MTPAVPLIIGGVAAAGGAVWYFFFRDKDECPPGWIPGVEKGECLKMDDDESGGEEPPFDKSTDQGKRKEVNGIPVCERTGTPYDADRFSDPATVAAMMAPLGYAPGPTLVAKRDKQEIKLFQKRAIALKLPGAGSTHGQMSPCTLVSLGAAVDLFQDGKWDLSKARG